jgi:nitrous oxidase accessory protein NosD
MHSLIRAVRPLAAIALVSGLMPSSVLAQNAASEAAQQRKADRECEDVVLPDGTVAECPSPEASQTAAIAHAKHADVLCPPPTREEGERRCVIDENFVIDGKVTLDEPLRLESFTRLDCGGLTLLPKTDGVPRIGDKPNITQAYSPSTPQVAILLAKAHGVTIQNCRIGSIAHPFDFGVVVLDSKLPSEVLDDQGAIHQLRNKLQDNTIAGRYTGVLIGQSDDTVVADNQIDAVIGTKAGTGINVLGDSDLNHLEGNTVVAHTRPDASAVVPVYPGTTPEPQVRPRGIHLTLAGAGPGVRVSTICLDAEQGELVQIPGRAEVIETDPNFDPHFRQEGNVVEGNIVDVGLTGSFAIANGTGSVRPVLVGNTIVGAHQAFHFSGAKPPDELFQAAGRCSLDPQRYCGGDTIFPNNNPDAECFIPSCGDTVSKGPCKGAKTMDVFLGAIDPLVMGNTVDGCSGGVCGKVENGINVAIPAPHATILQNTIRNASVAGIRLNNQSLENTTVSGNRLVGNRFGLALVRMSGVDTRIAGSTFASSIYLNDIMGSTQQAIATGVCKGAQIVSCEAHSDCGTNGFCMKNTMPFPAELSLDGQGNYWGRACSDSDGFRSADEPDAMGLRDTSALNINDSHPYGVSVFGGVDATTLTCH